MVCISRRQELAANKVEGIRVCTVMPTSTDTPFFDHAGNYTGHESVPIPPLYDPEEVVDTIVRLAVDPQDEVAVGAAGRVMTFSHNVAPGMSEAIMGKLSHREMMEKAPPAPDTPGSVLEPSAEGTELSGGRLNL